VDGQVLFRSSKMNFEICKKCVGNPFIKYHLENGINDKNLNWKKLTQYCFITFREKDYITVICEFSFNKEKRINSFEEINPDDCKNCKCYSEQLICFLNKE
jgi:hypothetical protein